MDRKDYKNLSNELRFLSDEQKMERIKNEKDEFLIFFISMNIENDGLKIQSMGYLISETLKIEVIKSINDDTKRIDSLNYLNEEFSKVEAIKTFTNDNLKVEALKKLKYDSDKIEIIETIKDDKIKISALNYLKSDSYKFNVMINLSTDEKKLEALQYLNDNNYKAKLIKTMKEDNIKLEALKQINNVFYKVEIIETLQSDEKKKEALKYFDDEKNKGYIIISIKNEDMRIELLQQLNDDDVKANIIVTISDIDKRINLAKNLKDNVKIRVIDSLNEDKEKLRIIESISDESLMEALICRLREDDSKLDALKYLNDDFSKARVLGTVRDDQKIIDGLAYLKDDYAKIIAMMKTDIEELIIDSLDKLKDDFSKLLVKRLIYGTNESISLTDRDVIKKYCLNKDVNYAQIGLDRNITIGVEIESEGEMSKYILKLEELATVPHENENRSWKAKKDDSLNKGVEVVSPILTDTKEDVEDIYMICSFLKKCRQNTSERCGGHIHIGADYLKSKEAYVNLFEIWGNVEKILYKISNEKNTIPRISIEEMAAPVSKTINEEIEKGTINIENEENLDEFIKDLQYIQENRYVGLNLLNINNGKNTIEFRIPNGTINPDTWIENIRLFGRIVQISEKLAEIEKQTECSEEDLKIFKLKEKLKEDIPEQDKFEVLLELLFLKEERQVYRERYNTNSKILEQLPDEENPFGQVEFGKVNFKKKHNVKEFRDIAVNARMETTKITERENINEDRTKS